jgi:hypothetical protein
MPSSTLDTTAAWVVRRLPTRVLYWAVIRAHALATTGRWSSTPCPADAGTILQHLADDGPTGHRRPFGAAVRPWRDQLAWTIGPRLPRRWISAGHYARLAPSEGRDEPNGGEPATTYPCQTCNGSGEVSVNRNPPPLDVAEPSPEDDRIFTGPDTFPPLQVPRGGVPYLPPELLVRIPILDDDEERAGLDYEAWTVIANAYGGDWSQAAPIWRAAAIRWRDRWHATLR